MLINEVLSSVEVIPDPYVKSATYAKIGERLVSVRNEAFKQAFMKAMETVKDIDDPMKAFRALLSIGYSMGKAGLKSAKRIYQGVLEDSRILPDAQRDAVLQTAVTYLIALGDLGEAVRFAREISNRELRNETLYSIIRAGSRAMGKSQLEVAYRVRKIKLALEYIDDEPYRSKALLEVIKAYLLMGNYDGAVSMLGEIGVREWAKRAFKEVVFFMKEKGVLGHYIDVLGETAEVLIERFDGGFGEEMALAFALSGQGSAALDLLRRMGDNDLLVKVALELLDRDAGALVSYIDALNDEEAVPVGKAVLNRILERRSLDLWDVVVAVGRSTASEEVWAKIARFYVLNGRLEDAMKIGMMMKDKRLRSIVLADVAHNFVKAGNVDRAIDAALEVRDMRFASFLVSEILLSALDNELRGRVVQWNGSKH